MEATVKVSKVVAEVKAVLNAELSIKDKKTALSKISLAGRPGCGDAELMIKNYNYQIRTKKEKLKANFPKGKQKARFSYRFDNYLMTLGKSSIVQMAITNAKQKMGLSTASDVKREKANEFRALVLNEIKAVADFEATGLPLRFMGKQQTIETVQNNKSVDAYKATPMYAQVGNTYFVVRHDETEDWDKYSKSWHNAHGPYREITDRYVTAYQNGSILTSIHLNSFAGNFLFNAIVEALKVQKVKVAKELKAVQLVEYFGVKPLKSINNVALYERTLAGETVDYCAVANGVTFHALTIDAAISGLREKLEKAAKVETERIDRENTVLNYAYVHEKYGFCESGTRSFCELNGLDFDGEYTLRQVREALVKNREANCSRYKAELKQIGIILNCK
jgi:hypothetical protein